MTPLERLTWFWKTDNERISLVRDVVVAFVVVMVILTSLWAYTGQWWTAPMVAIESGSMEHPEDSGFGRLGTIDAGDMVLVVKVDSFDDVIARGGTYGGVLAQSDENFYFYWDYGDVIIYKPMGDDDRSQIIHRAMCWVDVSFSGGERQYTIEAYGIYNETQLTIPELGLHKRAPEWDHDGFLTKGDNNAVIDQVSSICPQPVKVEWITGKARSEIPWLGTINLFFEDLMTGKNTVGNVHQDCLICLGLVIGVLVSIPVGLDVRDYIVERRKKQKE